MKKIYTYKRQGDERDVVDAKRYCNAYLDGYNQALRIHDVVGRSEQLTCPRCKSTNILNPDKDNDAQCIKCAFIWAG